MQLVAGGWHSPAMDALLLGVLSQSGLSHSPTADQQVSWQAGSMCVCSVSSDDCPLFLGSRGVRRLRSFCRLHA
jgi:hypothetical protein